MTKLKVLLAIFMTVISAGCGWENSAICSTPYSVQDGGLNQKAEYCIHVWAYRLAGSNDSPQAISKGVIGACEAPILSAEVNFGGGDYLRKKYERIADFRVIQARAGHCKVPVNASPY